MGFCDLGYKGQGYDLLTHGKQVLLVLVLGIGGVLGGGVWRSSGPRLDVGIDELDFRRKIDKVLKDLIKLSI